MNDVGKQSESRTQPALQAILESTRRLIREHAGADPDRWFYANRYVFARLSLDERGTKAKLKRNMLDSGVPCHACGMPFESKVNVHIHRVNEEKGYSTENTVLMHAECHRRHHAQTPSRRGGRPVNPGPVGAPGARTLVKASKEYKFGGYRFWWDFQPAFVDNADQYDEVQFVKKSTGEVCTVLIDDLLEFFTDDRKTFRGAGNWGVKILVDEPNKLAFEPPAGSKDWRFLDIRWEKPVGT